MSKHTPAPAFPFVGARAQVTVAEWDDGRKADEVRAGDIVLVGTNSGTDNDWWCVTEDADGRCDYIAARHLRPVPVSPGPDQPTEHEDWRAVGRLVRCGKIGTNHWATFTHDEDAARAVADHQDAPALRARVERFRSALADMNTVASEFRDERDEARQQRDQVRTERDAARAELDAATTDGLADAWDWRALGAEALHQVLTGRSTPAFAARMAERARLADEATTDDKETDRG